MNEIKVFEHEAFGEIRTVMIDGEPWFVGKDVAEALGYGNTKDALARHVDAEDKRIFQRSESTTFEIPARGLTIINESGLYSLILSSKLPGAKAFKRWITSEVLPSIRKNGGYVMDDETLLRHFAPDADDASMRFMMAEMHLIRRLTAQISENKPLVEFANHVIGSKNAIDMNSMAKLAANEGIPIGSVRLFRWLRKHRILIANNLPYQEYIDRGYFSVREKLLHLTNGCKTYRQTLVTGKGQAYIIRRLYEEYEGV